MAEPVAGATAGVESVDPAGVEEVGPEEPPADEDDPEGALVIAAIVKEGLVFPESPNTIEYMSE